MGRRAIKTEISRGDKSQLERWANSRTISVQQRDRAVMVLESTRGTPVKEIARKLDTYPNKVILWRNCSASWSPPVLASSSYRRTQPKQLLTKSHQLFFSTLPN